MSNLQSIASFNGSNNYIQVPGQKELNPAQFTVSCWAKVEGGSGQWRSPVTCRTARGSSALGGYILYAGNNNKWQFWTGNGGWVALQGADVVLNTWTHVAATYDGSTMKLYINGELSGSPIQSKILINNQYPLRIGAGMTEGSPTYFFNGKIAEVRLWDKARSQEEIQNSMHQRLKGDEQGLVAYWPLNQESGTSAEDKTGKGNPGTLHGATWAQETLDILTPSAPEAEQILEQSVLMFDGENDYIATPLDTQPSALPATTWEAWVKPTRNINHWDMILSTDDGGWDRFVGTNGGQFRVSHGKEAWNPVKADINQWQHIAVVYSTDKQIKFYKNGTEYVYSGQASIGSTKLPFHIGRSAGNTSQCFQGFITEVRVWDSVRTAAEIQNDMHRRLTGNEPGLVGYWPLNEGQGTIGTDRSNQGHDGTINGATWTEEALDIEPATTEEETLQAIASFNGSNQYIEVPYKQKLNPAQFTVSCWAKVEGGQGQWRSPVTCRTAKGSSALGGYLLYAGNNNKWQFWTGNGGWVALQGADVELNTWTHVAATYDGSTMKLYINGEPSGNPVPSKILINSQYPLRIGAGITEGNPGFFFNGKIAEVRLWDKARSQEEIQELMHQRLTGSEAGLVGYWPLDAGSGTTVTDKSGHGHNGTTQGTGVTWETSDLELAAAPERQTALTAKSSAITFDGTDDYITIALNEPETEVTHEFWFKTDAPNCGLFSVVKSPDWGGHDRHLYLSSGNIKTRIWNHEIISSSGLNLADNTWHHVAHVFGASIGGQKVYIDGQLVASGTKHTSDFDWQDTIAIAYSDDAQQKHFQGQIAEVRIWKIARSPNEIQQTMHQSLTGEEEGLIGYWPLNDGSGTTLADKTSNNHPGTLHGGTWTEEELLPTQTEPTSEQSALMFDGEDDHIATTLDAQPSALPATTWEAWVKPTRNINCWENILSTDDQGWDRSIGTNGGQFGIYHGKEAWKPVKADINRWQHIAVVYGADKHIKFYKNGTEYVYSGRSTIGSTKLPFHIGRSAWNPKNCFQGFITEVRVWDSARTAADIQNDMNRRLTGNEPGLVGYWPLNEGQGTTGTDQSNQGHDGTINGATWETSDLELPPAPKVEPATAEPSETTSTETTLLTFDGVDDYVNIPTNPTLDLTDNFTIEAWIKPEVLSNRIIDKNIGGQSEGFTFDTYPQNLRFINKGIAFTSRTALKTGTWQHVAVTFKHEANGAKLYINGEEENKATPSRVGTVTKLPVRLGSQADKVGSLFKGEMAEVRMWNQVRSQDEIKSSMNQRLSGDEEGLVGYWPLNEGTGTTAKDNTSNDSVGTIHGATWETSDLELPPAPKVEPATAEPSETTSTETTLLTFDGVDDYVNIPTNPTLDLTDNFTIEAWIKPEVLSNRIIDKNIGGQSEGFTFDTYPQNLRFINKGIAFTSRTALKTGTWQHVAVTFKHEANGAKLYINGEEENKATPSRVGTVTKLPVRLGSQADKVGSLFKGEMAEVRIWNRVRSPEEIKASMNQQLTGEEEGLMAYWPLNEGTGTTAEDHTSHGNTGTVHSGTWATSDLSLTPAPEPETTAEETEEPVEPETTAEETEVEEESLSPASLMFDGIDDYVTIPNSAWETSALSVELWAKASQNQSNYAGLLSSSNNLAESDSCQIDVMGGFYRFYHSDIQVRIAKVNQEWQHLVVTYDGKVVQTYLNGEPQNSKAVNAMTTVFRDYVLGRNRNNDKYFAGELSDVRIWNKALTADEVQEAMGYRLTGDESGLVAYWPLDEGKGDAIADRTGNTQPGVMNGATWQSTDLELSAADEDNDISPEPEPTPKPASKKRIPLDRSVTSITVLKSDEDFGGRPETLYGKSAKSKERKKRKKRKKQSKYLSPYEKYVRKVAKRQDEATHTYVERHKRSNRKKKNGWLKDFAKNYSKSVSKLF